ncbi:MAG: hypothetical protein Q4E54_06075 [Lachnospiraceae bacterium]|nr:hypothetical protein [Lachnospiraceae bacterium]
MDETRMLYANELGKTNFTLYNNHDRDTIRKHYPDEGILVIPSAGGFSEKMIRCYCAPDDKRIFINNEAYRSNRVYLKYAMDGASQKPVNCNIDYSLVDYGIDFIDNYKFEGYTKYAKMFEEAKVPFHTKEVLFEQCGAKVYRSGKNSVTIKCRDDYWIIKKNTENGKYVLLHNNYTMVSDTERIIDTQNLSFHIQAEYDQMSSAIKYICNYSFEGHVENALKVKAEYEARMREENRLINRIRRLLESIFAYPIRKCAMQMTIL